MKTRLFVILVTVLALAGCAQSPVDIRTAPERDETEPVYQEPKVAEGISFSVSGNPTGPEECFVRYEIGYPEDISPVELTLDLEDEMKREDGSWLGISWMEGIRVQVPSSDAVGNPRGGGLLHYIQMGEILLACDQVRTRVIVHACEPAPCPPLSIDSRENLFELLLDDRTGR